MIIILLLINLSFASLVQPENGSNLNYTHVLFEWTQQEDAISYNFMLSITESFNSSILDFTNESLIHIEKEHLNWDTSYYWKIRPIYSDNSFGEWSEIFNFSINSSRSEAYALDHNLDQYLVLVFD